MQLVGETVRDSASAIERIREAPERCALALDWAGPGRERQSLSPTAARRRRISPGFSVELRASDGLDILCSAEDDRPMRRVVLCALVVALSCASASAVACSADPTFVSPADGATINYGDSVVVKVSSPCTAYYLKPDTSALPIPFGTDCTVTFFTGSAAGLAVDALSIGSHTLTLSGGLCVTCPTIAALHVTVLSSAQSPGGSLNPKVTAFIPANDTTVSATPKFSLSVVGVDSNKSLFVYVSDHWQVSDGALSFPLALGGTLQLLASSPGSNTWTGSEDLALLPGTYYWQWWSPDVGYGPVEKFTVGQAATASAGATTTHTSTSTSTVTGPHLSVQSL
jgi:hypothetical protein